MKVFEAVARAFASEGVERVYTLMGTAIVESVGALDRIGVPLIHVHHEGAGLAMADAQARIHSGVAACVFTWGPGMTNATLQFHQAMKAHSSVVVLTARPEDRHEAHYFDHKALAATTGCGYVYARRASDVLAGVRTAFYQARTERRPVICEFSPDVLAAELPGEFAYTASTVDVVGAAACRPAPATLAAAATAISGCARPILIAGRGALRSGARAAAIEFAGHAGALLATTLPMLGWFDGDPFHINIAGGYSRPLTRELFREADLVIAAGASLNRYTMDQGKLFGDKPIVQIDTAPELLLATDRRAEYYLQGDAAATLRALTEAVTAGQRFRTDAVRERIARQPALFEGPGPDHPNGADPDRVDPRPLIHLLDAIWPANAPIVFGSGHQRDLGVMHLKRWRGPHVSSDGAIGQGLAFGMGAALGLPGRPVAVVEGDAGVLMNIQELNTAVRYGLPLLLLVMNNAALGSEYYQLPAYGFAADLAAMPEADFAAVARGFGCHAATITDLAEFRTLVEEFLANPRPTVADVRISREIMSFRFRNRLAAVRAG